MDRYANPEWLYDQVLRRLSGDVGFVEYTPDDSSEDILHATVQEGLQLGQLSLPSTPNGVMLALHTGGELKLQDLTRSQNVALASMLGRKVTEDYRPDECAFVIPTSMNAFSAGQGLAVGLMQPGIYKTEHARERNPGIRMARIALDGDAFKAFRRGAERGSYANVQRFLGALAPNHLGVESYARLIELLFKDAVVSVAGENLRRMGLLQAVAAGSGIEPRLMIVHFDPTSGPTEKLDAYIGKGIMFDSGGLSLKPSAAMLDMKTDMMGSAAVLSQALWFKNHPEELKRSTLFVMPLARNDIGPNAVRVGDVVRAYDGRRVTITNTDAEGRLILADTAAYVCDQWKRGVRRLMTVATLTGHAIVASGNHRSPLFVRGNKQDLWEKFVFAGDESADKVQPLYLDAPDFLAMESPLSDLLNSTADRNRGAMTAAAFIMSFIPEDEVEEVIHLDIARCASSEGAAGKQAKGIPRYAGPLLLIEETRTSA